MLELPTGDLGETPADGIKSRSNGPEAGEPPAQRSFIPNPSALDHVTTRQPGNHDRKQPPHPDRRTAGDARSGGCGRLGAPSHQARAHPGHPCPQPRRSPGVRHGTRRCRGGPRPRATRPALGRAARRADRRRALDRPCRDRSGRRLRDPRRALLGCRCRGRRLLAHDRRRRTRRPRRARGVGRDRRTTARCRGRCGAASQST